MAAPPPRPDLKAARTANPSVRNGPWLTLLLAVLLLAAATPDALQAFAYERAALARGEWWRIYTGHFVHFGPGHLVWNLLVLLIAGGWLERLTPGPARVYLLTAPLAVGLGLHVFRPALAVYAGYSGVAAGLFALLALTLGLRAGSHRLLGTLLLVLLLAKTLYEFGGQGALFVNFNGLGVRVEPAAHLIGLVWAGCVAAASQAWDQRPGLRAGGDAP